jgi:acyl-coenzyme A thioesterase PaaI-like protein
MCFVEIDVSRADGKPIAHVTSAVRGRFGAPPAELAISAGDHGGSEPGKLGPAIARMPFGSARGFHVEHMAGGSSRIRMPATSANTDADGGVHEGALLALLDTTGAMAAWAETGVGPYKASTPSLQARILAPPPDEDLVAYGRMLQRDAEILWSEVEVAGADSARVCARGTVIYRIVT